ncbi:Hypothetical protein LUCI_0717 [Lucifera butyrica]|uniref:Uncharacterized protein n=1 Tax=Lucifera butyrica TaxID=1351585 RepID=A0A498R3T2_9FIRM|nr:Hypothetical protein LUCI_0717 [Lucifera butyrica]
MQRKALKMSLPAAVIAVEPEGANGMAAKAVRHGKCTKLFVHSVA